MHPNCQAADPANCRIHHTGKYQKGLLGKMAGKIGKMWRKHKAEKAGTEFDDEVDSLEQAQKSGNGRDVSEYLSGASQQYLDSLIGKSKKAAGVSGKMSAKEGRQNLGTIGSKAVAASARKKQERDEQKNEAVKRSQKTMKENAVAEAKALLQKKRDYQERMADRYYHGNYAGESERDFWDDRKGDFIMSGADMKRAKQIEQKYGSAAPAAETLVEEDRDRVVRQNASGDKNPNVKIVPKWHPQGQYGYVGKNQKYTDRPVSPLPQ